MKKFDYYTTITRRIDEESFMPLVDLTVTFDDDRVYHRVVKKGISGEEALEEVLNEALAKLKEDAKINFNERYRNV